MVKGPVIIKEQQADFRIDNFDEVVLGYTKEQAVSEASRCLQCANPVCVSGCPVGIDIKKFIGQISRQDFKTAYFTIREKNNFPSICGRVCPAEYQCRKACVLSKKGAAFALDEAINIHFLERFAGDYGIDNDLEVPTSGGSLLADFKIAVVGSGPAGLCCAGELARTGIKVDVYESLHKLGGVLRYGIPSFRLSGDILDYEIDYLKKQGVRFFTNVIVGRTKSIDDLFNEGYNCVFLGVGAGVPVFPGILGENSCNIYSANEFLTRVNLMSADEFPFFHTPVNVGRNIIVIGGGNTAMDSARVALRLQRSSGFSVNTTVLYRRSETEMPARRLEIEHARQEGVNFQFLVQPKAFISDEKGLVRKIRCLKCELGSPDASGRRRPVIIENSDFEMDCDMAVIAIGLKANQLLINTLPQLKTDENKDIVVNPLTMETSIPGVFAGGDIVGGEGTVIEAMGMAKKAAWAMAAYLKGRK